MTASTSTKINPDSLRHAYQQVADAIAASITDGTYTIRLPSERDLAEEFEVSYITMRHAMKLLRERDLIESIHGRGTYVADAIRNSP